MKRLSRGQSIIEVLIGTAVVAMVITTVAAGMSYSVKNTAQSKYRTLATYLAQEAIEVLRRERSLLGWDSFVTELGVGLYCYNTLPADTTAFAAKNTGACTDTIAEAGTTFTREMEVETISASSVRIVARVKWQDGAYTRQIELPQEFKEWQ